MKEGLKFFTDTYLTSIGLLIFFLFFVAVIWWVTRAQNKKMYRYIETLPFENGDRYEQR